MALTLQFVGMEVRMASDLPNYMKKPETENAVFVVTGVKLYRSCSHPVYAVEDQAGNKQDINGMFLDFSRWLSNKRPVFPVVIKDDEDEYHVPSSRHYRRGRD